MVLRDFFAGFIWFVVTANSLIRRGAKGVVCGMSGILAVPIHGAEDEVLELPKDQLPDDPNEIMQILANELAPLKLWLELAVSYYQQQRIDQFTVVMETSTGEEGVHPPHAPAPCLPRSAPALPYRQLQHTKLSRTDSSMHTKLSRVLL